MVTTAKDSPNLHISNKALSAVNMKSRRPPYLEGSFPTGVRKLSSVFSTNDLDCLCFSSGCQGSEISPQEPGSVAVRLFLVACRSSHPPPPCTFVAWSKHPRQCHPILPALLSWPINSHLARHPPWYRAQHTPSVASRKGQIHLCVFLVCPSSGMCDNIPVTGAVPPYLCNCPEVKALWLQTDLLFLLFVPHVLVYRNFTEALDSFCFPVGLQRGVPWSSHVALAACTHWRCPL